MTDPVTPCPVFPCTLPLEDHASEAGSDVDWHYNDVTDVTWAVARPTPVDSIIVHIRQPASKRWRGNQFYSDRNPGSDPQAQTLCGAAPATRDMSHAETRWPKYLVWVTCPACRDARSAP